MAGKVVVTINSTGRQAASFIRAATAVGWHVRAQVLKADGLVAEELASLPGVELVEGDLGGPKRNELINRLFLGARIAFINTTHWGDEVAIGKACADAAKRVGVSHYIYSSMPDHSVFGEDWRGLPMWASKFAIENYVRQIGIPATFVYTGIYNNNFTSLPYPLFQMELQPDGSFVWQAPFHPNDPLPWLDAEHDVGPTLLQIFKMGANHWKGQRVTLAFEKLTPVQCCARFSRGVGRPVNYVHGPIKIAVSVPSGYREQLEILQETLGDKRAPYFGPDLEYPREGRSIWEGYRGIEEYAREVFPIEEYANGLRWMEDGSVSGSRAPSTVGDMDFDDAEDSGHERFVSLKHASRPITPAGTPIPLHITGAYTPSSHPEGGRGEFFVGSC
ncbi:NmrA-domain-containing protein [Acrodontium crateriforme]|uniref:NmrA-domain-containing protein n=1 Tax=Acrodontium crateriforme TaxID=150365 RepID=A0AAQ3M9R7_9PEZI|nr:NmrA-domain-containing protein [Acrodontium crateriforme]